jgi:recombination DNA repair RAD52 pathway protein
MRTREEVEKDLESNIPREAVEQRSAGGSKSLSYLASWYVIDRLNKVFGNLGWDSETVEMRLVSTGEQLPAYVAKVRIKVSVPALSSDGELIGYTTVIKEGTGWGSDKSKLNPHEMATKEAESDALKRAAMKLGISMGLGLYDKSGEFIDEAPKTAFVKAAEKALENHAPAMAVLAVSETNRDVLNKKIGAISRVVIAKKLKTVEELKAMIKTKYSVDSKEALSDTQAKELNETLEGLANGK